MSANTLNITFLFSTERILNEGQSMLLSILDQIGGLSLTMNSSEWENKHISWQDIHRYYLNLTGQSVFFNLQLREYNNKYILFVRSKYEYKS